MRRFLIAASMLAIAGMGCQKDDKSMASALKQIDERLGKMEASLAKIEKSGGRAGAAAGRRGRPPGPDPASVYSVDVTGAAFKGAKDAKITVVEAFEFA